MACPNIETRDDSEREEGEIVDDLDELSDVSSEEEFLLRQRLQVLESYNHVLERKEAKRSFIGSGKKSALEDSFLQDLSEISNSDIEDSLLNRNVKQKHSKTHHKTKRRRPTDNVAKHIKIREHKRKTLLKKKIEVKIISESSDESNDDFTTKRRKLANAVSVSTPKNDGTTLKDRIMNMICSSKNEIPFKQPEIHNLAPQHSEIAKNCDIAINDTNNLIEQSRDSLISKSTEICSLDLDVVDSTEGDLVNIIEKQDNDQLLEDILCLSSDEKDTGEAQTKHDLLVTIEKATYVTDSDEDIELLRQHALKTKATKVKQGPEEKENKALESSDGEDSDTVELRMICLKSALLKRAIEMKQKQKLQKRLSQSSNFYDEVISNDDKTNNKIDSRNNTDIESVDMEIGSDAEEKSKESKEVSKNNCKTNEECVNLSHPETIEVHKQEEVEEDEDLLRAKLLTSLSKNLPNLVEPSVINSVEKNNEILESQKNQIKTSSVIEEKKFIINLEDSDSEGEHEATKNLTKMHMKLSEQIDFQNKLDIFLKSTRLQVEGKALPDVIQKASALSPKPAKKYVPKAVNHLPKSEQIEYKNLVKRMAELEKMKQARQSTLNIARKPPGPPPNVKETLKPRNISVETTKFVDIEKRIAISRKKIAEESATVMKLKDEAKKLSQKYKIVATELKNISTAISLNKREQKAAQLRLSKVRAEHQLVLKSSINSSNIKSMTQEKFVKHINKTVTANKLQKENDPTEKDCKNINLQRIATVEKHISKDNLAPVPKILVTVDFTSTKKILENTENNTELDTNDKHNNNTFNNSFITEKRVDYPVVEKGGGRQMSKSKDVDDYISPLQALGDASWEADPNAILCPFDVGGNCKDTDCKYFHPTFPTAH